jgi:hypothetical protein
MFKAGVNCRVHGALHTDFHSIKFRHVREVQILILVRLSKKFVRRAAGMWQHNARFNIPLTKLKLLANNLECQIQEI